LNGAQFVVCVEQLMNPLAQLGIRAASILDKLGTLIRLALECAEKDRSRLGFEQGRGILAAGLSK
jgi:hypothetical protein